MNANNKSTSPTRYSLVKDCINNIEIINIWISVIFSNRALIFIIDRGLHSLTDLIRTREQRFHQNKVIE